MKLGGWFSKLGAPARGDAQAQVSTLLKRGIDLHNAGEHAQAQDYYRDVLAQDPEHPQARRNLGNLLALQGSAAQERGNVEEALESYLEALALAPGSAQVHNNLGNAYRSLGRDEEAIACFRDALALDPALPEAHLNLGIALQQGGSRAEAAAHYRAALAARPAFADASLNLGYLRDQEGDWQAAEALYREAIAARPDCAEAHFNLALNLLGSGDLAAGWREYEWRLRMPELAPHWPFQGRQRWDGGALNGETVLLYAEQGFGDALQFVRYAPLVARKGGRVILQCQPKLKALFERVPEVASVVSWDEPPPGFDLCCSLLSLPRIFGTTLESIPGGGAYLEPDPAKAPGWREKLAAQPADARVGLFWATDSRTSISSLRSMSLDALAPLAQVPGVVFYSLQRGAAARQTEQPPHGMKIVTPGSALADFSDDAALIANLDLVISIDSATAHLAGALGKAVWTLVSDPPEWRWLRQGETSPWYPHMRLLRRSRGSDSSGTISRAASRLAEFVAALPRQAK